MSKVLEKAKILENSALVAQVLRMTVFAPRIASQAQPGQFVQIKVPGGENFLRRPLSISDIARKEGIVCFVYRVVGKGTAELARLRTGGLVDCMGPLGSGFKMDCSRPLLVGGGMGIAPLIFLARQLKDKRPEVLVGGKNRAEMFWNDMFKGFADKVYQTTDDGSVGLKGFTVQFLPQLLAQERFDCIYTCGPEIMMRGVAELAASYGVRCQVSLEKRMACGFGVCLSCTFETKKSGVRKKVCVDGPVFDAEEVF